MNRVSNRHQLRLIAEVPVTPLLDLVLIILFVFLIAAPLLKQDAALASPTPSAAGKAPAATVTLAIGADAGVKLDGAVVAMAALPGALEKLAVSRPDVGVIVQAPRDLPVHRLVDVMGLLKAAKIRHTAVTTAAASQR